MRDRGIDADGVTEIHDVAASLGGMPTDHRSSGSVRLGEGEGGPQQPLLFFKGWLHSGTDSSMDKDELVHLEVIAALVFQEVPVRLGHRLEGEVQISRAIIGQRGFSSQAFPHRHVCRVAIRVDHHLVVIASKEHRALSRTESEESIDYAPDVRTFVDVVSHENELVGGMRVNRRQQDFQSVKVSMDIANRQRSHVRGLSLQWAAHASNEGQSVGFGQEDSLQSLELPRAWRRPLPRRAVLVIWYHFRTPDEQHSH
jgi:hypothetical protein